MTTKDRTSEEHRRGSALQRFLPKYLYALLSIPFLFTAGVFSPTHRFLIFQIARHFGLKLAVEPQRLPLVPLPSVLNRKLDINLLEPLAESGNVSLLELMVIATLARRATPPTAFEIGTFDGRTALNVAANLGASGKVFTLDLPRENLAATKFALAPGESTFVEKKSSGTRFSGTEFASRITQLYGDSATFDFSPYEGQIGLIFIDGSHAYDYVRKDTENALRLASSNAIILWHDYDPGWPDVIRALNDLFRSDPTFKNFRRIEGTSLAMLQR